MSSMSSTDTMIRCIDLYTGCTLTACQRIIAAQNVLKLCLYSNTPYQCM